MLFFFLVFVSIACFYKSISSSVLCLQLSHPYMTTRKTIALIIQTFVDKVMSLLFNTLSSLVIAFLPRIKCFLISWLQSPFAVMLEPKKIKSVTVSIVSPSIYHWVVGPDGMILVFSMLSFKPNFSFSSFTFIKRLFSSSSFYAIKVVSSAYLRILIFLPSILIPACASSSPAFCMMYSAYKLNKQGDNIQLWHIPFTIWNQSVVPCLSNSSDCYFLTCIKVSQEASKVAWYSHLLNFPQFVVIHTVKCFRVVSDAEVDAFLEFPCFFYYPMDVGSLISGSSTFSKFSLTIWKFFWLPSWYSPKAYVHAC